MQIHDKPKLFYFNINKYYEHKFLRNIYIYTHTHILFVLQSWRKNKNVLVKKLPSQNWKNFKLSDYYYLFIKLNV